MAEEMSPEEQAEFERMLAQPLSPVRTGKAAAVQQRIAVPPVQDDGMKAAHTRIPEELVEMRYWKERAMLERAREEGAREARRDTSSGVSSLVAVASALVAAYVLWKSPAAGKVVADVAAGAP